MRSLANFFLKVAEWLDPPPPLDAFTKTALPLVEAAERMAEGTSGDYKRHVVYGRFVKLFPNETKHLLGLAVELALVELKRR